MMQRSAITTLIVLLTGLCSLVGISAEWPQWRGPDSNGISREVQWCPGTLKEKPRILWRFNTGKGHSAVITKGDCVYTMGSKAEEESVQRDHIFCLDARTAEEVWHYSYPCEEYKWCGPRSTPLVDGSLFYSISWEGDLYCLDALSGKVVWKRNLVDDSLSKSPSVGYCASPVVHGDLLLLNAGRSGVALNKKTGEVEWASEPEECGISTPVLYHVKGVCKAAISGDHELFCVDVETGKQEWSMGWISCADPIQSLDRLLLIGGSGDYGAKLFKVGGHDPELVWRSRACKNVFQTGVTMDGYFYGFGYVKSMQSLVCMELETGDIQWKEYLGEWGSLTAANQRLIILDGDGDLLMAEASPERFEVISRARLFDIKLDRGFMATSQLRCCWSAPILSNGLLYARDTEGNVICIDLMHTL